MKRWTTMAACLLAAACSDGAEPLAPNAEGVLPASLLGLAPAVSIDPTVTAQLNLAAPTDRLQVLITFDETRTTAGAVSGALAAAGAGIIRFRHLPTVLAVATPAQVAVATRLPGVRSVYANKQLRWLLAEGIASVRADAVHAAGYTGRGVGIAILDSGIDGVFASDLAYPSRTVQNVKWLADPNELVSLGSILPVLAGDLYVENLPDTETSVGHGTHVAGIAAGDGTASSGYYRGVAPGADLIGLGTGDVLFVFWALAAFDYILENRERYNIQVVNNSWGGSGAFDPADPTNVATKKLFDAGVAVVFAAGNEGPGEGTLNPHSAAPWVISVAAGCKTVVPDPTNSAVYCADGRSGLLADFSSRGIPGDPLFRPDIVAPGVSVVAARAGTGTVMNGLDLPADLQSCNLALEHLPFYTCSAGTSMAAPFVAGAIALLEEAAGGDLSPADAYAALTGTARAMPGYMPWEVGAGYMDVEAAVNAVVGGS